jgi:lipopolysaccharide transport system permease protein
MGQVMRPVTVIEPPSLSDLRPLVALGRLPRHGDLLRTLTAHRFKVRYKQSRLGIAWAMLQPLVMMLVFTLMFVALGRGADGAVPYAVFAYAALVPWTAFASGLANAASSLTSHASLLTKVYFPREILPITYVLAALADFALASVALAAMMIWFGIALSPNIVWALVAIVLMTAFLTAASLLLSAVQVRYRDVGIAMPMLLQVWMFASPVVYSLDAVRQTLPGWLFQLYVLNPMTGAVDTFRRATVLREAPDLHALGAGLLVTMLLLPLAYAYFKFAERTMADAV